MNNGYTGTAKYQPAGIVHRGESLGPCACGGLVHAFSDGELIAHTSPLDLTVEHTAVGLGTKVLFRKEAFESG